MERFDAIIIGAGAAGIFCSALAGQAGRRVLLIDNGKNRGAKSLCLAVGAATLPTFMSNRALI